MSTQCGGTFTALAVAAKTRYRILTSPQLQKLWKIPIFRTAVNLESATSVVRPGPGPGADTFCEHVFKIRDFTPQPQTQIIFFSVGRGGGKANLTWRVNSSDYYFDDDYGVVQIFPNNARARRTSDHNRRNDIMRNRGG